jgi:hypothetical protein
MIYDQATRGFIGHEVSVETEYSSGDDVDSLIVYLPGTTAGARESSESLLRTWLQYGDVLLVEYGDGRFFGDEVVAKTIDAIRVAESGRHYDRLIFVGSSMGGLLSIDAVDNYTGDLPVSLVVVDAPTSSEDLVGLFGAAPALRALPFGPIWNGVDVDGTPYDTSFWRDQITYVVEHGVPERDSLDGKIENLIFLRCTRDNQFVRASAADRWVSAFSGAVVVDVDSGHVDYHGEPELWNRVFNDAFTELTE